ncbi:MAG: hypothetical protein EOP60_03540 [Sphingomonadales bacterium]|nr:MAG: hypothetical protein EOP60_03540 [Sphingomonadales bacterium]
MNLRNRKTRLAIVLAIGVFAAFVAWRTNTPTQTPRACTPGREEIKDAGGKVVEIKRVECHRG